MKTITQLFNDAWKKKNSRGWDYVYVSVDIHGVILPSNYDVQSELALINSHVENVLRYLSEREDVILILWSSSHSDEILKVRRWLLSEYGIDFNYINENPLEKNTLYADFSKKFYFSICLDDKCGFDPNVDWAELEDWMKNIERNKLD